MMIVQNRSICRKGFNVRRPMFRAVGSPSLFATQPCATSCTMMAKMTGGAITIILRIIWAKFSMSSTERLSVYYRHELAVFHGKEEKFFQGFAVAREAR